MDNEPRARELALEGAVLVFFVVALVGLGAGAESYIAVLRGAGAAALVAYLGRFPARVVLEAMAVPAPGEAEGARGAEPAPREAPGVSRRQRAA